MTRVAAAGLATRPRVRVVDLTGIAPVSPPCEDSILLLKYRPVAPLKGFEPFLTLVDNQPTSPDVSKGRTTLRDRASSRAATGQNSDSFVLVSSSPLRPCMVGTEEVHI